MSSFSQPQNMIQAFQIGAGVNAPADTGDHLYIQGVTSQGVFLKSGAGRVIFLTSSPFRGPLTVNFPELPAAVFEPGRNVPYQEGEVVLENGRVICWRDAPIWQPAPASQPKPVPRELIGRVCDLLIRQHGEGSLAGMLPSLLRRAPAPNWLDERFARLIGNSAPVAEEQLARLIGYGRGLTPSGDDFVCGMGLGWSRYGIGSVELVKPAGWQERLMQKAFADTTLVSANILVWSLRGQSDERIISALDELFGENGDPQKIARGLSSWGSSSGVDTFTGLVYWLFLADYLV